MGDPRILRMRLEDWAGDFKNQLIAMVAHFHIYASDLHPVVFEKIVNLTVGKEGPSMHHATSKQTKSQAKRIYEELCDENHKLIQKIEFYRERLGYVEDG